MAGSGSHDPWTQDGTSSVSSARSPRPTRTGSSRPDGRPRGSSSKQSSRFQQSPSDFGSSIKDASSSAGGELNNDSSVASLFSVCSDKDSGPVIVEIGRIFKGELARCQTEKEVQILVNCATRIMNAAASDSFSMSGRLAYQLREATRVLRSSNYSALAGHHKLPLLRSLHREAERRRSELADELSAFQALYPDAEPSFGSSAGAGAGGAHGEGPMSSARRRDQLLPPLLQQVIHEDYTPLSSPSAHSQESPRVSSAGGASGRLGSAGTASGSTGDEPALALATPRRGSNGRRRGPHLEVLTDDAMLGEDTDAPSAVASASSPPQPFGISPRSMSGSFAVGGSSGAGVSPQRMGSMNTSMTPRSMGSMNASITPRGAPGRRPSLRGSRASISSLIGLLSPNRRSSPRGNAASLAEALLNQEPLLEMPGEDESKEDLSGEMAKMRPTVSVDKENLIPSAFKKFKDDGQVHRDDLGKALAFAGYTNPDEKIIEQAFGHVSDGFSTLGLEEFAHFAMAYESALNTAIDEAFTLTDEDESGFVCFEELQTLLKNFGILPMRHILEDIVAEVDADGSGVFDRKEFHSVMELIRVRMGFTKDEYTQMMVMFSRCDRKHTGVIETSDLENILSFLNYTSLDKPEYDDILKDIDMDGDGTISVEELMVCMRKVREAEISKVRQFVEECDNDGSGTMSLDEMPELIKKLNYWPDVQAVREVLVKMGYTDGMGELDASKVWEFLSNYRAREGFSNEDLKDIEAAFARVDEAKKGSLTNLEVGRTVRDLGYAANHHEIAILIAMVDLDSSGTVSLSELRKLLRIFMSRRIAEMKKAFAEYAGDASYLVVGEYKRAMKELGLVDTTGRVMPAHPSDLLPVAEAVPSKDMPTNMPYLSMDGFINTAIRIQRQMRQTFKQNGGFSAMEIENLKGQFEKYDRDASGDIGSRELAQLLGDIFPDIATDPAMRPMVCDALAAVDVNNSGSLNWVEFVQFMDRFREVEQSKRHEKERQAVETTKFQQREVEEFRELFHQSVLSDTLGSGHGGSDEHLSFRGLLQLLKVLCPMGAKNSAELLAHINKVCPDKAFSLTGSGEVDFPEFLLLSKELISVNFANIGNPLAG